MPRLRFKTGQTPCPDLELGPGVNSLGRNPANQLVVDDPAISNFHCEFKFETGVITVKDLGSTNGTFLNGVPIQEGILAPGQSIQCGLTEWLCEYTAAPATVVRVAIGTNTLSEVGPAGAGSVPVTAQRDVPLPPPVVPARIELQHPCKIHLHLEGDFVCSQCQSHFCAACVPLRKEGRKEWRRCIGCGGPCLSVAEDEARRNATKGGQRGGLWALLTRWFRRPRR